MAKLEIKFKIVTPERTVFEDAVSQVTLPTSEGEITILPNHQSYIASLQSGEIMFKKDGKEIFLAISGGFIEFHNNALIVLADTAERAEEIDLERAQIARKRAQELKLKIISTDETDYARVAAMLEKQSARIKVARKNYTKRGIKID